MSLASLENFSLRDGLEIVGSNAIALFAMTFFSDSISRSLDLAPGSWGAWVVELMVLAAGNFIGRIITGAVLNALLGRR